MIGLLDEVVPQYSGRILQDSYINRDYGGILNRWAIATRLGLGQFTQLAETGETPVRLLGGEPMMCI